VEREGGQAETGGREEGLGLCWKRRSTDFAHCKALLRTTTSAPSPRLFLLLLPLLLLLLLLLLRQLTTNPAIARASFVVASEQRLPAKDDGRAALRHRLRIKILLTAESEFHFKVEFNYIRACLPARLPSRFLISAARPILLPPLPSLPSIRLAFPFSSITFLLVAISSHCPRCGSREISFPPSLSLSLSLLVLE